MGCLPERVSAKQLRLTEEDNEIGRQVRANLAKLRKLLLRKDMESSYSDNFAQNLQSLVLG